jgi:hypothetical protein
MDRRGKPKEVKARAKRPLVREAQGLRDPRGPPGRGDLAAVGEHLSHRALLGKLKERFRRYDSQPVGRVIAEINPILRGWVNYFRIGNSGRCLAYVRNWVEKKVRRHLMRARNRAGFGWARWSTVGLYAELGVVP